MKHNYKYLSLIHRERHLWVLRYLLCLSRTHITNQYDGVDAYCLKLKKGVHEYANKVLEFEKEIIEIK